MYTASHRWSLTALNESQIYLSCYQWQPSGTERPHGFTLGIVELHWLTSTSLHQHQTWPNTSAAFQVPGQEFCRAVLSTNKRQRILYRRFTMKSYTTHRNICWLFPHPFYSTLSIRDLSIAAVKPCGFYPLSFVSSFLKIHFELCCCSKTAHLHSLFEKPAHQDGTQCRQQVHNASRF